MPSRYRTPSWYLAVALPYPAAREINSKAFPTSLGTPLPRRFIRPSSRMDWTCPCSDAFPKSSAALDESAGDPTPSLCIVASWNIA